MASIEAMTSAPDCDRRRSPRFPCSGLARIVCLPFDGVLLEGRLRNLSLGGCCVETASPLLCGTRAELLVRVDALSFRALTHVLAIQNRTGVCMEFLRLSAGGRDLLQEALAYLEKSARRHRILQQENDPEASRDIQELLRSESLKQFPVLGGPLNVQTSEHPVELMDGSTPRLQRNVLLSPLDLFI